MTHPVFVMHDANAKVIRAQLFFLSIALIFMSTSNVTLSEDSSILGIGIKGLELDHLIALIASVVLYQLVHFVWVSWESLVEWRLRLTALGTGSWGGNGLKVSYEDEALKVRQTTLYAYIIDVLDSKLNQSEAEKFSSEIAETLNADHVQKALLRFDSSFKMFCRIQNIRWIVIEFGVPLALGLTGLFLASVKFELLDCLS